MHDRRTGEHLGRLTDKGQDDPREASDDVGEGQHNVVEVPHHWWSNCGL